MTTVRSTIYTPLYHRLMREFPLRRIATRKEADAATAILDKRFRDKFEDSGEEQYILILADLLADYEDENDPVPDSATGVEVLRYLVEENDVRQHELAKLLDITQGAVSMLLSGDRAITAEHMRRLGKRFGVDPGVFL